MDERLRSALDGVKLTEQEERYLEWLSRMDGETVETFSGLFEKIKQADREAVLNKLFPLGMPDNGNYGINAKAVWMAVEYKKKTTRRH